MAGWPSLPPEIQVMVWEILAEDPSILSRYARVSKDWCSFFERKNFYGLTLHQDCLKDFRNIVRQRRFIRHIWLRVRVRLYGCPTCKDYEHPDRGKLNEATIRAAIQKLFTILSKWKMDEDRDSKGLTLEISVHSTSDTRHHFQYLDFDSKAYSNPLYLHETEGPHDPFHGWHNGQRKTVPTSKEIMRLFGRYINLKYGQALPKVDVVTSFLIRRQSRRQFSPYAVHKLIEGLPNLEYLHYEPWRSPMESEQERIDAGNALVFLSHSDTIKCLTLFEDFNENFNLRFSQDYRDYNPSRRTFWTLGDALALACFTLERLSASFLVDAKQFFGGCIPGWTAFNLVSLALTSQTLHSTENPVKINDLLNQAGIAAQKMPKLKTMEIWNGGRGHGCIFGYYVTDSSTTLSWKASWGLKFQPRVIETWKSVAVQHDLALEVSQIPSYTIKSHADVIKHLKLKNHVLHPVSLHQIQQETKVEAMHG
ncbi:hypothetical protein MW887_007193 [Aspergillus wentii]|nr:hypothetical protein MW887_007193 [Aspergillus wentii]